MRTDLRMRTVALLGLSALVVTVAHGSLVSLPGTTAFAAFAECSDGKDNDSDGSIDYPQDSGCVNLEDDSEGASSRAVFVTVSDGLETITPGNSLTYTVALRTERKDLTEVDVELLLPHQSNIVGISNGGSRNEQYVRWDNVTINPGQLKKLFVDVSINPFAKEGLLLVAEARSEGERATDTTRVSEKRDNTPLLPLSISITDNKQFAEPQDRLDYKITVENDTAEPRDFTVRTQLPVDLELIETSDEGVIENRTIEWRNQFLLPGEVALYGFSAIIRQGVPDLLAIRVKASVDGQAASDTTSVHKGVLASAFSISVNDGEEEAIPGEKLTYEIVIKNNETKLGTEIDVSSALPTYTEFVSASEGGFWTGSNVRWHGLTVSPKGEHVLHVTARVRSDAPIGATLQHVVLVKGHQGVDVTEVVQEKADEPDEGSVYENQNAQVLLRKVADQSEVRPGDRVGFTVYVRNTTGQTLRNLRVEDRMDEGYMSIEGGTDGQMQGNSAIVWVIPVLEAGQEWTARYTVRIAADAPHGTTLQNIVSVSGDGIETLSLAERILTSELNIVRKLPPTGAAFDALFLMLTALLGAGQTFAMKRMLI